MSRSRTVAMVAGGLVLLGIAGMLAYQWLVRPITLPGPTVRAVPVTVSRADFAGAEACRDCHARQYDAWSRSTHGRAGGPPSRDVVIAPFDGRPIRFRDAVVTPTVSAGGEYAFTVAQPGRENVVYRVAGVIGGGHMVGGGTQGFAAQFPDGTLRFLPFDFIRREGTWFCNTNGRADVGWVPITPELPIAACADWAPTRVLGTDPRFSNCQECHASQIEIRFDPSAKRYETTFASLTINCESCHGPAARHVEKARGGTIGRDADIGLRTLATLGKDQSLEICFQCHAVKDVLNPGYLPGEPLQAHYSLGLPALGDRPFFPDGRVRTFAYQENHRDSDCYLNGSMTCVDCHEPHASSYRDPWGAPLAGRFDDRQCTACHASKAVDVQRHTRHPARSPGSACVACHMPFLQHPEVGTALRFARSDHVIGTPRPALDSVRGIVGACAQCHRNLPVQRLEEAMRDGWGELKPQPPLVAALLDSAGNAEDVMLRLLRPDLRHEAAQERSLAELLERHLEPDMASLSLAVVERLEQLGQAPGLDVRAMALAALHLAQGERRPVRRFLARQLRNLGDEELLIRDRWRVTLGYLGDRYREAGQARRALAVYAKALDIAPDHPALLLAAGLAYAAAGDHLNAVEFYGRSLRADPARPLVHINLGVALEALGDGAGATAAYRAALDLNPAEPLALFNLGNGSLRRGDAAGAIDYYQRAIGADRGLAPAHANLARAYAAAGRMAEALMEARWALELAPDDPASLELLTELQTLTGPR